MTAPDTAALICIRCGMTFRSAAMLAIHTERHPQIEKARAYLAKLYGIDTLATPTRPAGACADCEKTSQVRYQIGVFTCCVACTSHRNAVARKVDRPTPDGGGATVAPIIAGSCQRCERHADLVVIRARFLCTACARTAHRIELLRVELSR